MEHYRFVRESGRWDFFGRLSDRYGRRHVMLITSFCLSVIMIVFAIYLPSAFIHSTNQSTNSIINLVSIHPIIFAILRTAIGFLIGGVWPTAETLAIEYLFQDYKYEFKYYRDNNGKQVEQRKQSSLRCIDTIISNGPAEDGNLLKVFKDMYRILENLFEKISETNEMMIQSKKKNKKLRKYLGILEKNISNLKAEKIKAEKIQQIKN